MDSNSACWLKYYNHIEHFINATSPGQCISIRHGELPFSEKEVSVSLEEGFYDNVSMENYDFSFLIQLIGKSGLIGRNKADFGRLWKTGSIRSFL